MARSQAQRAHARLSMAKINAGNKENDISSSGGISDGNNSHSGNSGPSNSALRIARVRVLESKRLLHNTRRKLTRAENTKDKLRTQAKDALSDAKSSQEKLSRAERVIASLKKAKNTLRKRDSRVSQKLQAAAENLQSHSLKEKGVFKEEVREMTRDLTSICRVPLARVNTVIHAVARGLGVTVNDTIDKHSAARITLEGQVAADLQLVTEIHDAGGKSCGLMTLFNYLIFPEGLTISGDGTTDKHLNYESKHGLLLTPTYATDSDKPAMNTIPTQRFFGINAAIDHKSETQLQGWRDLIDRMYKVYNESPLGCQKPLNPLEFARFVTGMNTDHAEDQKKLFRLFEAWKASCEREMRGQEALLSASLVETIPLLWNEIEQNITEIGGMACWEALSPGERESCEVAAYKRLCIKLGEDRLDALTPEQRRYASLFIWGGCCMHKEMNSVKGGNVRMMAWWSESNLEGPMKLFNRDNSAAAALGGDAARKRASEVSQAGGVKLTSLAGAVFANKDKKKGQQDTLQVSLQSTIGYMVSFPGTSSTRYGSHADAAVELVVRLEFYRQFLELVRDLKEKRNFTNIEQNIYLGLHDIPTLTELCVLILYAQAITHPYMRQVRGPNAAETNLLDMGPVHENVIAHCRAIINNPDLLLSSDASYTSGSMDRKVWERPDAFYAVQALAPGLPHLHGAMVAFFEGALETWLRFTHEYQSDGPIASATAAERQRAYMLPTNDDNEGGLGGKRVTTRHAPNMTLESHNARAMYRKNNTAAFIRMTLSLADRKYLRRKAREIDSSGLAKERREAQAVAYKTTVERKRKAATERKAAQDAKRAKIDAVIARLDVQGIKDSPGTCADLDLQLDWHRLQDSQVPKKKDVKLKTDKIKALVEAIERHNSGERAVILPADENTIQVYVPSDLDEEESDWK